MKHRYVKPVVARTELERRRTQSRDACGPPRLSADANVLAARQDAIACVHPGEIESGPAAHEIASTVAREQDVISRPAVEDVFAGAAVQPVVSCSPDEAVVPGPAVQSVVARKPEEAVIARSADEAVGEACAA